MHVHQGQAKQLRPWPDLIQKAKDGGLNTIETYVFWNGHEPQPREVRNFVNISLCDRAASIDR